MNSSSSLVEIHNVFKSFDDSQTFALANIQASISYGKIVGLVGPDGAGKTTLLRLLTGLLLPTKGTITVAGYRTDTQAALIHTIIGYMPQKFGLYEDLTVQQNMILYANLRGVSQENWQETFNKLLDFTALTPFIHRLAKDLSGGMKQKLGLACALVQKPTLLLLDEPSVGVDPIARRELWKMVFSLMEEGISVIWSTAYLDEAEKCHSVLLLNEGKILFAGKPQALANRVEGRTYCLTLKKEINPRIFLPELLQDSNVLDGTLKGNQIRFLLKEKDEAFLQQLTMLTNIHVQSVAPNFEDGFIDILGGVPYKKVDLMSTLSFNTGCQKPVIAAKDLVKIFGNFTAADHLSFQIYPGEIFGLLGPNGAGKSTTFKMLCGLLTPTSGEAFVNGYHLQQVSTKARSYIGYMAQKFSLYGLLSVKQNLDFFGGIYGLQGADRKKRISEMIDIFGLQPYLQETAETLSLGYKQRLALACAIMHKPKVLFLDEATSGVDPITRREFWQHINQLAQKGVTVIVTTHFMDEAEYCDRIGLIDQGKLIAQGTPYELKARVSSPAPTLEDAFIFLVNE